QNKGAHNDVMLKRPLREIFSQRPFQHNAYDIMRTNINQGRIQSLAVMIAQVADSPGKFLHQRRYQ
ncbi:hypothetical protein, partial [Escherichia sp. AM3]|uniref:hypothetical protein n=1 Tax=Escherichia sp. AM3 TaxID=3070702 RepID=UPI00289B2282